MQLDNLPLLKTSVAINAMYVCKGRNKIVGRGTLEKFSIALCYKIASFPANSKLS